MFSLRILTTTLMTHQSQKPCNISLFALIAILIFFLIEAIILKDYPFFWDSVSKSYRAEWFLDNKFNQWTLPTKINSGHPPLWPLSLALTWSLFGKTLLASRLLMAILNTFVFYQAYLFLKKFIKRKALLLFLLLFLIEPTFLAQTTVMNNDILLLGFTFLGLNSVINNNKLLQSLALAGILLTNLRGIGVFSAFALIDILTKKKSLKEFILIYFTSAIPFTIYLIYQYHTLGWILFTPSPNWNGQRKIISIVQMTRNIAVIGFDLFIYGKFLIFIIGTFLLIKYKDLLKDNKTRFLLISFFSFLIVLSLMFIPFSNPIGVRYYMVVYWIGLAIIARVLYLKQNHIKKVFLLLLLGFLSFPLWIFPRELSQPWDATLSYFNYFPVEKRMLTYIEKENISFKDIGTNIPLNRREHQYLSEPFLEKFSEINIIKNPYILYSNIENETKEKTLHQIELNYTLIKMFKQNGVYMELWKKNN